MHVTGLYALVGYTLLALWFVGIMLNLLLGEVTFLPSLIPNTINIIEILIINGALGLIASLVFALMVWVLDYGLGNGLNFFYSLFK